MPVTRNVQFTQLIKAGGRLREFNFRKSNSAPGPLFHLDVAGEGDMRYQVVFKKAASGWILQDNNIPKWIQDVIPQILKAIEAGE